MPDHRTCTRRAYAKLNLALAVGPPIAPPSPVAGYHPIASWMMSVDLFDDVTVTRLDDADRSTHAVAWAPDAPRPSPIDWAPEKDLSVRAHRLLERESGRPLLASVRVSKRIPVGGGLGGGSSDGAAVLLALRDVFELPFSAARLAELSSELGSDVAFFVDERVTATAAIVTHLGERIERIGGSRGRRHPVVLIFPPFGCPTGAVYREYDASPRSLREAEVRELALHAARTGEIQTDVLFNDLESAACAVEPRLREIVDRVAGELNCNVHMTGSGSTLFVLMRSDDDAVSLASSIPDVMPGVSALATRLLWGSPSE